MNPRQALLSLRPPSADRHEGADSQARRRKNWEIVYETAVSEEHYH